MRASLQSLEQEHQDLSAFASFLKSAIDSHSETPGSISTTSARRLAYNALIISMYGALERFLEDIVQAYVTYVSSIHDQFAALPKAIRESHTDVTIGVMRHLDQPRFANATSAEELVGNLHSCLLGRPDYTLNSIAYRHHSTNFRPDTVNAFVARIGIVTVMDSVLNDTEYQDAVEALDDGLRRSTTRLEDIVERRNEVAHGSTAQQLISLELLRSHVDLVKAFCRAVYRRVLSEALDQASTHHGRSVGPPISVLREGLVATLDLKEGMLTVGDGIVVRDSRGNHSVATIMSLMVDGNAENIADASTVPQRVGLGFDRPIRANVELFQVSPELLPP